MKKKNWKRIVVIMLTFCMIITGLPVDGLAAESQVVNGVLYGDANGDSQIDMKDVLAIQKYVADDSYSIDKKAADINRDGSIDATDTADIKKYIAEWDISLSPADCVTVQFDTQGGTEVPDVRVANGDYLDMSQVQTPTKEDGIFLGWYTDEACDTAFVAEETALTADQTLYARYQNLSPTTQNVTPSCTLTKQSPDMEIVLESSDESMTASQVQNAIALANVGELDPVTLTVEKVETGFKVTATGGYEEGGAYQLSLNDDRLKFQGKEDTIRTCNYTIDKDEVINLGLSKDLSYIKQEDVSGDVADTKGKFEYAQADELQVGDKICVYSGTEPDKRNTTENYDDQAAEYVKVTEIDGDTVSYAAAEEKDVVNLPETIPVNVTDMSTQDADNHVFTIASDKVQFSSDNSTAQELSLDTSTRIDEGDYLAIQNGKEKEFAQVTSCTETDGVMTIAYDIQDPEETYQKNLDYYDTTTVEGDTILGDTDVQAIEKSIEKQVKKSGFAQNALKYLSEVAVQTDGFTEVAGCTGITMTDEEGNPVSGKSLTAKKISLPNDIEVNADISTTTKHFDKGLRVAVSIKGKIQISPAKKSDNVVNIDLAASFEEEVQLSKNINGKAVWKKWKGFFPYIADYDMNANIDVYNYTGISLEANLSFGEKDGEAEDAIDKINKVVDIGDQIKELMESDDDEEIAAGRQNLFEKYGEILQNDTEYIDVINKPITDVQGFADPFHIIAYSVGINFVVGANMNVALGSNLEYQAGTRYNFWFKLKAKQSGNSKTDLCDEDFAFQFYAMGELGLKAGLQFDFEVGLISTKLDSIGLEANAGIYTDIYGYLFYQYSTHRDAGSSDTQKSTKMSGALYIEFGVYLDISVKAQVLNGLLEFKPTLVEQQWPLLYAGDPINVYDFSYSQPNPEEQIFIQNTNVGDMDSSYLKMRTLSLTEGTMENKVYPADCYNYNSNSTKFSVNPDTGAINVTPEEGDEYLEADIKVTWKSQFLAFTLGGISRTIHVAWTNLSDDELVEKYGVYAPLRTVDTDKRYTYDYTGNAQPYEITYLDDELIEGVTVQYSPAGKEQYTETAPSACGSYDILLERGADKTYRAYKKVIENGLTINKLEQSIAAPISQLTGANYKCTSVTVTPVEGQQDGTVMYAASTVDSAPKTGWTASNTVSGLRFNSSYYVFTKICNSTNYKDAVSTQSLKVSTAGNPPYTFNGKESYDAPENAEWIQNFIDNTDVEISTSEQLFLYNYILRNKLEGASDYHVVTLNADLDMSAFRWEPMGYGIDGEFHDTFNGNGHVVKNLFTLDGGFISSVGTHGFVKNLGLEDSNILDNGNYGLAGGIARRVLEEGKIINSYVEGCYIYGTRHVGQITGWNQGTVKNCYGDKEQLVTSVSADRFKAAQNVATGNIYGYNMIYYDQSTYPTTTLPTGADTTEGTGGKYYIYMAFKYNELNTDPITNVFVREGKSAPDTVTGADGCTYTKASGQDLNDGAGGKYLYLYYTRDPKAGAPLTNVGMYNQTDDKYTENYINLSDVEVDYNINLNMGTKKGDTLYLYQVREKSQSTLEELSAWATGRKGYIGWTVSESGSTTGKPVFRQD